MACLLCSPITEIFTRAKCWPGSGPAGNGQGNTANEGRPNSAPVRQATRSEETKTSTNPASPLAPPPLLLQLFPTKLACPLQSFGNPWRQAVSSGANLKAFHKEFKTTLSGPNSSRLGLGDDVPVSRALLPGTVSYDKWPSVSVT